MVGVTELGRPVDDVLAVVVDITLTIGGSCRSACLLHGTGGHQRSPRTGGLTESELARRVDDHLDSSRVDVQLFCGDLQCDGVHALAHLRPSVAHLDVATRLVRFAAEAHDGTGDLAEPVAETRVLQSQSEPDGLPGGHRGVVGRS